jgi:hypothetical protein
LGEIIDRESFLVIILGPNSDIVKVDIVALDNDIVLNLKASGAVS